jgi:hypothetical protein
MKRFLFPVLLTFVVSVSAQKKTVDFANKYSESITSAALKEKLSVIAGADMEGRETASPGQKKAAAYIENHFQRLGLLPGTTAGFQMQYPIYQDTLIEASLRVDGKPKKLDSSFYVNIASAANGTYDIKEIVYASYGIVDSVRNDYKDLDVRGKWVLILEGTPANPTITDRRSLYSIRAKADQARKLGAKGVFVMTAGFPGQCSQKQKEVCP